jgi:hypothetical protein
MLSEILQECFLELEFVLANPPSAGYSRIFQGRFKKNGICPCKALVSWLFQNRLRKMRKEEKKCQTQRFCIYLTDGFEYFKIDPNQILYHGADK